MGSRGAHGFSGHCRLGGVPVAALETPSTHRSGAAYGYFFGKAVDVRRRRCAGSLGHKAGHWTSSPRYRWDCSADPLWTGLFSDHVSLARHRGADDVGEAQEIGWVTFSRGRQDFFLCLAYSREPSPSPYFSKAFADVKITRLRASS